MALLPGTPLGHTVLVFQAPTSRALQILALWMAASLATRLNSVELSSFIGNVLRNQGPVSNKFLMGT